MTERAPLFLVRPDGPLIRMTPSAPATEDELQALLAQYPELIGDSDGDLLLVEREHGVPDAIDASARWALDHLFVTRSATPVLVEVKRAVDTRLRREVVGQMLDYAANGVAFWPAGTAAARFEATCKGRNEDAGEKFARFLGGATEPAEFWSQVDANFRAGRIKLVFVADEIPSELARIVEFLNEQMTADVRAIELRYFEGQGVRTLVPRFIGETERTQAQKSGARPKLERISLEAWLSIHITPREKSISDSANRLLRFLRESGVELDVASTQGSIFARVPTSNGRSAYPFFLMKNGSVQIGFGWVVSSPALESDESRAAFYERFNSTVGPLSTKNMKGFPSFPLDRIALAERFVAFESVAKEFIAACRG